jgi:dGTPase
MIFAIPLLILKMELIGLVSEDFALEYLIKLVKTILVLQNTNIRDKEDRISYVHWLLGSLINDAVKVFVENEESYFSR